MNNPDSGLTWENKTSSVLLITWKIKHNLDTDQAWKEFLKPNKIRKEIENM